MFDLPQVLCDRDTCVRDIVALGFGVPADAGAGVALPAAVAEVTAGTPAAGRFFDNLEQALANGAPVCLLPSMCGEETVIIRAWQQFCEATRRRLSDCGLATGRLAIAIPSHVMPPEAWCLIADAVLGRGPRYVFLDSLQFGTHAQQWLRQRTDAVWQFLFRQAAQPRPVLPVYGGVVRSCCPLLAGEVALDVLPVGGLMAPRHSAWLPLELDLTRFADEAGRLDEPLLHANLARLLGHADRLIDATRWPDREQAADALLNRRIALLVSGFGELAALAGEDPRSLECLERLSGIARRLRQLLGRESARLATLSGPVPALTPADLTADWLAGAGRRQWQSAWQEALQRSAVRHRNLVVMSPCSVLPADADPGYVDLLPVIAHADAWHFDSPASLAGAGTAAFRAFHCRARAIIQAAAADSFVAAGV